MELVIVATKNKGKMEEIRKIVAGAVSMEEVGVDIDVLEDGLTYEENAMKKAEAIMKITGKTVLADDSGIEIDFFGGLPGVNTSTFLTTNEHYKERNRQILGKMAGSENRGAKFVSVLVLIKPDGEKILARGELIGSIADEAKGEFGFAYDSIFYVREYNKTLAEIPLELKNKISHRAKAFEDLLEKAGGVL